MFKFRYSSDELLNLIPAPLTHEPIASNFAYQMTTNGPWGQTAMLVQRLQQHANHFKAQALGAMTAVQMLDAAIGKLKKELADLNKAEKALANLQEMMGKKNAEQESLLTEIHRLKQNTTLIAGVAAMAAANVNTRSSSSSEVKFQKGTPTPTFPPQESTSVKTEAAADEVEQQTDDMHPIDLSDSEEEEDDQEMEQAVESVLGIS
jgi:chromosome segregation ATPase